MGAVLIVLSISFAKYIYGPIDNVSEIKKQEKVNTKENVELIKDNDKSSESKQKLNINIDEKMEEKDGKVRFNISTNLPDTTELMITLTELDNGEYKGQTHITINNKIGQTEWFSNKGDALRNGEYQLDISMASPRLQLEKVRKTVGDNGELMEGPLVKKSELEGESYVTKNNIINLTSGKNVENKVSQDEEHKQVISQLYNELINEYNSQSVNCDELAFGQFLADWNRRRNEAQDKMSNEEPSMEHSVAIRDLIFLQTEIKNKLFGRDYDQNYINETMQSIENAIN